MSDSPVEIADDFPSAPLVINISTECEVNSRGINMTAKTHIKASLDAVGEEQAAALMEAKIIADAVACASLESLKMSMIRIAGGETTSSAADLSLAVQKIGGDLVANFLQYMHKPAGGGR